MRRATAPHNKPRHTVRVNQARTKAKLRETFDKFDVDRSGEIDLFEFELMMNDLCVPLRRGVLARDFRAIDTDGSGNISFAEFERCLGRQHVPIAAPHAQRLELQRNAR